MAQLAKNTDNKNASFYWYDYETFGINPRTHRIAQFAGVRTDTDLNIIGKPLTLYCQPTNDSLPDPYACLITGITPQLCQKKGVIEREFISQIYQQFCQANTCVVGYNNIRFDDEFTRYCLYRNFFDAYDWHWRSGNSRWDLIDVVRLCYALKKDQSLKWPLNEKGEPTFRLDQLAPINDIDHTHAHDALSDVMATIALAKKIKTAQPKLFAYALSLRDKKTVAKQIQLLKPMLHTSGMYPNKYACTRLATAITFHPKYQDSRAIIFNLDQDPQLLLDLSPEALANNLFSKKETQAPDQQRPQLKELIFNKSPMFVTFDNEPPRIASDITEQLNINVTTALKHLTFIRKHHKTITKTIETIYQQDAPESIFQDADQALYDGFFNDANDQRLRRQVQTLSEKELSEFNPAFSDRRLAPLLLQFKGRNYPNTLSDDEKEQWFEIVQNRLQMGANGYLSFAQFQQMIKACQASGDKKILKDLSLYADKII